MIFNKNGSVSLEYNEYLIDADFCDSAKDYKVFFKGKEIDDVKGIVRVVI